MKIIIGKFSNQPFHALSKKEVSLLCKLVPSEWSTHVSSVVLSSKIFNKTRLVKPIEYTASTKQLTIYSRGLIREDIAKQLLLELALINAELSAGQPNVITDLDLSVKPYFDKFLKARI